VEPLQIDAPDAATGMALAEKLAQLGGRADLVSIGARLRVSVSLQSASRDFVPRSLAATREWLEECELDSTSVRLDGHTHLLRADRPRVGAYKH
jgi:hypothetical protein